MCAEVPQSLKDQEPPHEENKFFPGAIASCGGYAVHAGAGHYIELVDIPEFAEQRNI
ncbi:MAG TPA: hypothetical protein VJ453_15245 [Terriglobales bacterium]|jgi:hypothetical protein|nr:hypothetical protein [Terriglobales bacterium]